MSQIIDCPHKISFEEATQKEYYKNKKYLNRRVEKLLGITKESRCRHVYEQKFIKSSHVMNSILPKISNPNVNEMDDLLYPNINISQVEPSTMGQYYLIEGDDWILNIVNSWHSQYYQHILKGNDCEYCEYCNYVIDTVSLQIIEKYPPDSYGSVKGMLMHLLYSNDVMKIVHAMKLLRLLFEKNISSFFNGFEEFQFCLIKLLEFKSVLRTEEYSPRIGNWISNQLSFFIDKIKSYEWEGDDKLLNIIKNGFEGSMQMLLEYCIDRVKSRKDTISPYEHLWFPYFKFARDEVEKLKRMKIFIRELFEYHKTTRSSFVNEVVRLCVSPFDKMNENSQLEEYFGANIELLTETDLFEHATDVQIKEKLLELLVSGDDEKLKNFEDNFLFSNLWSFKEFNMCVYLLSEIINAFKMCREQGWMEIDKNIERHIFRNENGDMQNRVKYIVVDNSNYNPIFMDILMKKFPILFFDCESEYLIEDLRKVIKGEADEHTVESFFFLIDDAATYEEDDDDDLDDAEDNINNVIFDDDDVDN